jgi:integrase
MKQFVERMANCQLHELKDDAISAFCLDPTIKPRTQLSRIRYVSYFFNYAIRKGWAQLNPADKIMRPIQDDAVPGIFTVDEAGSLLEHADKFELLPYIALGLFAGVRAAEIQRLDWSAVNFDSREIVVGASIAKKRSRRITGMNDTLIAWLQPFRGSTGPIVNGLNFTRRMAKLKKSAKIMNWPNNACRHSFASYGVPVWGAQYVAEQLGHRGGEEVLHNHYKALVSKHDAEKYWALRPYTTVVSPEQEPLPVGT